MKLNVATLFGGLLISSCTGCNFFNESSEALTSLPKEIAQSLRPSSKQGERGSSDQPVVANPPATTIRFDGSEVVLGTVDSARMTTEQLNDKLRSLVEKNKLHSATKLVGQNMTIAEQLLWELIGQRTENERCELIAHVLSQGIDPAVSWNGMLAQSKAVPAAAAIYYAHRRNFSKKLQVEQPSDAECEQLRIAAQGLKHPLPMIDALHLCAVREMVAGRHAWAESLLLQAIELAERNRDLARAADMCLMASVTAQATGEHKKSAVAWTKAVEYQLATKSNATQRFDISFWQRADKLRPAGAVWPQLVSQVLQERASFVGCNLNSDSPPELVLYCVFASAEYAAGNPQLALIHFKKAESLARPDDVVWLRIAQGKCLAALGQTQAAAAILSAPAGGTQSTAAAAAMAALGSAKLQSGAYQQGAQLLHKALNDSPSLSWSTRNSAEADLALAFLIIGDTEEGLQKLAAAQHKFKVDGDIDGLLHSLENELEIAKLEARAEDVNRLSQDIAALEQAAFQ